MSNQGSRNTQDMAQMIGGLQAAKEQQLSKRRGQSGYKTESGEYTESKLTELLKMSIEELAEYATVERVSLEDVDEVKKRTILYMRAAQEAAAFPSSAGLSRSLGYTRRALEYWRSKHPETPTAQWLETFSDMCADVLSQSALKNNCNTIMAIFINKALYNWRESSEIVLTPGSAEIDGDNYNAEEIRKRYMLDE